MRKVLYFCYKCGDELSGEPKGRLVLEVDGATALTGQRQSATLCPECFEASLKTLPTSFRELAATLLLGVLAAVLVGCSAAPASTTSSGVPPGCYLQDVPPDYRDGGCPTCDFRCAVATVCESDAGAPAVGCVPASSSSPVAWCCPPLHGG
jgi:hypothetical protein